MKRNNILIISLAVLFIFQSVFAQKNEDPSHPLPDWVHRNEERRARMNEINGIGRNGMMIKRDEKPRLTPLYKGKESETKELEKAFERTKSMLVVPQNYFEKYKVLLKDRKVSLARLQPEKNCYNSLTVTVEELKRCFDVVPIPGNGSFYSFRSKLNYPIEKTFVRAGSNDVTLINTIPKLSAGAGEKWWNIHFIDDNFDVANDSVQGIISEIGNVDLENLNLKSREFEFLNNFKPKQNQSEVREQNEIFKKGVEFNTFIYSTAASMKPNSTYVLRSISYHSNLISNSKADKKADMIIAFKVIGRENDGSVIILWKELQAGRLKK